MKRIGWIGLVLATLLVLTATASAADTIRLSAPATVSPGGQFSVDVYVEDTQANIVATNITFDSTMVQLIRATNYSVFSSEILTTSSSVVSFAGVSTTPVNIQNGVKILTLDFRVNSNVPQNSVININVTRAVVNLNTNVRTVNASITVTTTTPTTTTPTPTPTPPQQQYFDRDVTFSNTNARTSVTIKGVSIIESVQNQWVLTFSGAQDINLVVSGPTSNYQVRLTNLRTGAVNTYNNANQIPISDLTSGDDYRLEVVWFDDQGNQVASLNINNANTFDQVKVDNIVVARQAAVIHIQAVPQKPVITVSADPSEVAWGDRVIFKVSISDFDPATMQWIWVLQGPYYGDRMTGGPFTTRSMDIQLDTGDLRLNRNGVEGTYRFVVVVRDVRNPAQPVPLNYGFADVKISDIDINIVHPTDTKIGKKIRVIATTNVKDTGSKYDIGLPNQADISIRDPNGNALQTWAAVPIKDGKIESPLTFLLHPRLPTGVYQVVVTVTTYAGISETETKYFTVTDAEVNFNMPLSYVRGSEITFQGTTSLATETPPQAVNYMWVFITPEPYDVNTWNIIEEFNPAQVIPIGNNIVAITAEGFVSVNDRVGLLAVVTADGKFKTDEFHISSNADFITYTFRGCVAYWQGPANNGQLVVTNYCGIVSIKVVKERIEVKLEPSVAAKGMFVKISGTAPRADDVVLVYTDERNVFNNVPRIGSEDNPFQCNINGNPFTINTGKNGEFSTLLRVSDTADTDTYVVYVIQPADRTLQRCDPTTDALGMATITIREFGFINAPDTFVMTQGDSKDLFIQIFGDPDNVQVLMDIKGHGISVRNAPLVKYNESADGTSGWLFTTLYTIYDRNARQLTDRFVDYDQTIPLKPGTSYVISLELRDVTGTVDRKDIVWTIRAPELKVELLNVKASQVVVGDKVQLKIDTNHESKGYDDIHVIVDLGASLRKYLSIPLDDNGDAVLTLDTAGWPIGTVKIYTRDRVKTFYTGGAYAWDWNKYYDYSPLKEGVSYEALKYIAADDDAVDLKVITVLSSAPTPTPTPTTPAPTPTTPTPTPTATPTTPTPTPTTPKPTPTPTPSGGIPGFEAVFAIAGLLAVAYLLRRR